MVRRFELAGLERDQTRNSMVRWLALWADAVVLVQILVPVWGWGLLFSRR
jgi:hypothetical protein